MHYKNGRPAKNGDKVLFIPNYGSPLVGILYDATAGNNDCNGRLAVTLGSDPMPDLKDCLHVDDVKAFVSGNSLRIPDSTVKVAQLTPSEPPVLEEKPAPVFVEVATNGCPDCGATEGHTRGCSRY